MATTKYKVHDFVYKKAEQGALVAMVKSTVANDAEVSTATETGSTPTLIGTGIMRVKSPNSNLLIISSVTYTFNYEGKCITEDFFDYKLMLAETLDKASEVGSVVETDGTTGITRGVDGSVTYTEEEGQSVVVSTLEARDQFAINALKTLMERYDKDPSTLSDNEMAFLCENAYQWAANMMTQASKVRATVTTETSGEGGGESGETGGFTRGVSVDSSELTDTTDKLINNIVAALEKTDESEGTGENIKYSERVSIPKLIEWLNNYSKHTPENEQDTKTTVGLEDLINAIKAIGSEGGETTVDFTTLVTAINATHTNNIGNGGLGRDAEHPIYMSGGGFPTKAALGAAFVAESTTAAQVLTDFLTFNNAGAVGYSTKAEVKKAVLGYLNSYATLDALGTAIYDSIKTTVDNRIKAWLEAARVTVSGTDYSITVNTPT